MDRKAVLSIIGGIGFLAFVFIGVWVKKRNSGWDEIIRTYIFVLFIIAILALVIAGVYWLFMKRHKNMVAINRNSILKACMQCRPNHEQTLHFKGDATFDLEPRLIGHIIGFCQIVSEPIYNSKKVKTRVTKTLEQEGQVLTYIAFRKVKGFVGSFFEVPKLVCCLGEVKKDKKVIQDSDYTSLNGEKVYLNGASFMPTRYDFFYLSRHYKKTWMIDECVKKSIDRYIMEEYFVQSQEIIDDGLGIGDKYKKERETSQAKELLDMKKGMGK